MVLFLEIFFSLVVGFVLGCIYSDAHWKPIVIEYKKAIDIYKLQR